MEISQQTIPHKFRNKYLRSGAVSMNGAGSTTYSSVSDGSGTGSGNANHAEHATKADLAEAANHLAEVLNIYGNPWSGTTDLEAISATTIDADSVDADELSAITGNINALTATTINSTNINNSDTIKTKNLDVTGLAHFFELVIDKIKAAGGAIMLTPADGFVVNKVEAVEGGYKLYWRSTDENGKGIMNMWKVNDQALCMSFNEASVGTSYNVANKYYWALVTAIDEAPVEVDFSGETHDCHYIVISTTVKDGTVNPEVDDEIVMCGYRGEDDDKRQSAILISAYSSLDKGLTAPLFAEYKGINDFDLESHRCSYIDATGAHFVGEFMVDNSTTLEEYVNQQFIINSEGLLSRVTKVYNPNILAANGWKDQDDRNVLQENEEDFTVSASTPSEEVALLSDDEEEELVAYPPVMYLDEGDYTMSVYARAKYKSIEYGETKDNLDYVLSVSTMINKSDTWHDEPRSQIVFHAPINGYYQLGIQPMDESYSGDTPYIDYENPSGSTSGGTDTPDTPGGGDDPDIPGGDDPDNPPTTGTTGNTIQTVTTFTLPRNYFGVGYSVQGIATVQPDDYVGSIIYSTSDPEVLTVDSTGKVTFHKVGKAKAIATASESYYGGKHYLKSKGSYEVNVVESMPSNISITNKLAGLKLEDTYQLNVEITPANYSGSVTYTSSNPSIATVSSTGLVTCVGIGDTTITASLSGAEFEGIDYTASSDSYQLSVADNLTYVDTSIEPTSEIKNIYVAGETGRITFSGSPSSYNGTITFEVSNYDKNCFSYTTGNGYINYNVLGECNVTIKAIANTYRSGKIVYMPSEYEFTLHCVESITYDTSIELLTVIEEEYDGGNAFELKTKVLPENYNGTLTYSSSNPDVAEVISIGTEGDELSYKPMLCIKEKGETIITITAQRSEQTKPHLIYNESKLEFTINSTGYGDTLIPVNTIYYKTRDGGKLKFKHVMYSYNTASTSIDPTYGNYFSCNFNSYGESVTCLSETQNDDGYWVLTFDKPITHIGLMNALIYITSNGVWHYEETLRLTELIVPRTTMSVDGMTTPNKLSSINGYVSLFKDDFKYIIDAKYNSNIGLPMSTKAEEINGVCYYYYQENTNVVIYANSKYIGDWRRNKSKYTFNPFTVTYKPYFVSGEDVLHNGSTDTINVKLTCDELNGFENTYPYDVTFESLTPYNVTVNNNGLVRGLSEGTASIKCLLSNNKNTTFNFEVIKADYEYPYTGISSNNQVLYRTADHTAYTGMTVNDTTMNSMVVSNTYNTSTDIGTVVFNQVLTSVTKEGIWANENVTYVWLPNSITTINDYLLGGYGGTEFYYPKNVSVIVNAAFFSSSSLKKVVMNDVTAMEKEVFRDCSNLSEILIYGHHVPTTVTNTSSSKAYTMAKVPKTCKVYVQPCMVDKFKADSFWKNYNIQSLADYPND